MERKCFIYPCTQHISECLVSIQCYTIWLKNNFLKKFLWIYLTKESNILARMNNQSKVIFVTRQSLAIIQINITQRFFIIWTTSPVIFQTRGDPTSKLDSSSSEYCKLRRNHVLINLALFAPFQIMKFTFVLFCNCCPF